MKSSITAFLLGHVGNLTTRKDQLQFYQELNQWSGSRFNQLNASSEGEWLTPLIDEPEPVAEVIEEKTEE